MRPLRRDDGATVVEMALILPLLLLVILGVVEFGRAIAIENELESASRDGVRFATSAGGTPDPHYVDCAAIRDATRARLTFVTLADSDIDITYDDGAGNPLVDSFGNVVDCQTGTTPYPDIITSSTRIIVTVRTSYTGITPLVTQFIGTINADSVSRRTIFRGEL